MSTKERPILFSAPMVRAILAGRKTQTRRIFKPQPPTRFMSGDVAAITNGKLWAFSRCEGLRAVEAFPPDNEPGFACRYGRPGDHLWVKETFAKNGVLPLEHREPGEFIYRAELENGVSKWSARWTPSIHMPRRASRITLEITSVNVERLNAITPADAIAEGLEKGSNPEYPNDYKYYGALEKLGQITPNPVWSYESLWESINGRGSWKQNPWVWVITFRSVASVGCAQARLCDPALVGAA